MATIARSTPAPGAHVWLNRNHIAPFAATRVRPVQDDVWSGPGL
jgi:hypothetical protein